MAAEDFRTNRNFARLPQTINDPRGQFMYVKIPASLFDTGTGIKQICDLPKGTRILDCKITTTVAAAASNILDVEVFDGATTTDLITAHQSSAVLTSRVASTVAGEVLLDGTANRLQVNLTTATTTNGAMTILLTLARENT